MDSAEEDDDYGALDSDVITRPQELIDHQKKTSTSKILIESEIDEAAAKRPFVRKPSNKTRERKSSSRHEKKGSSKEKGSYKSPMSDGSPIKKSVELSKRYEALKRVIQRELGDNYKPKRSEASKVQKQESDSPSSKSKKINKDKDKILDIPVSKIMKEPAITAMQRFHVLDARDAALRTSMPKPEDSNKLKIAGTCPDMCPEKERYGRIAKNCVSVLEMTSTFNPNASSHEPDHSCMVKEYSRSSADQQEPLSHELRPVHVLNLTMDYLICNVIDKYHESVSLEDWYDFIWNRTRSIRKDITQQQLCDPTCVEIIEKCVRFHIHCAEALSEEDTATFDPKINNENLTKCLQTLKHMYEDLQSKGIECPNEAEFRSYDILLSLTEGETLRLIKDIRRDLLKSPLIKSAFEAALAFNSDNYVKFFHIIRKADYLSSCILHRYMIKVRSNALQIIVRAYSIQNNASMYPISKLVNDLKFESEAEAADFCRCHGLEVNEEFITIDRKQFSKYPSGLPVSRSFLLVGQKKGNSLGLIINNGILPMNPKIVYLPSNSFDEHNMLKIDYLGAVTKEIGDDLSMDKMFDQEDEMETEDILPLPDDSSYSSKIETPLQDSHIVELEKRRAALLEELNKVEFHKTEELQQRKKHLSKPIEKKKNSVKSHSPSKSHKSIMFSTEKSDFPFQKTDIKPIKKVDVVPENFFKPDVVTSSSANKMPLLADSFFKFGNSGSSKAFDVAYASNSAANFPKVFTTTSSLPVPISTSSNIFGKPSLPSSDFPSFSFQEPKNFGFSFKPTIPASFPSTSFISKTSDGSQQQQAPDICQSISFEKQKTANFEVRTTIPKESVMSQQVVPEITIEDSDSCNKEMIQERAHKTNVKKSICIIKNLEQLEEEETIPENRQVKISQEVISESAKDDTNEMNLEIIEELGDKSNSEDRQKSELVDAFVDEVAEEILFETVMDCLPSICEEILSEERRIKIELDNEITKIKEQLAKNAIFRWRIFVQKRREKRICEKLAFYSPWQAILLNTPRIPSGAISPFVAYQKHCSLTRTTAEILKKRFEVPLGWEKFEPEEIWPLNSFKTPYADASYFGNRQIKNFFKLCMVFPHVKDAKMTVFMEWIRTKFALEKTDSSKFDCKNVFKLHKGETVIIVRAIELTQDVVETHASFLDGVTAMMLFVPGHSEDRENFLKNLTNLCDSSILDSPYPLYMYFMGLQDIPTDMTSYVEMKIDLSFTAVNMQCIPNIDGFAENSLKIEEGLIWFNELKDKARPLPVLKKINFRHYVEDAFSYTFSILLCRVSLEEYKFLLEDPQFIIDFYNRVIKFRASVLCNDFIKGINSCWPPEEIKDFLGKKFIDMQTQNLCKRALENLLLPDFEGNPQESKSAWKYARLVPSSSSSMVLSIKISDASVDWLRKIIYCAEHLIQDSDFILTKGDLPVYYVNEDLLDFGADPYWLNVLAEILPHPNSSKRKTQDKIQKEFESCSPLKKSRLGPSQSTPKVPDANIQNIFPNSITENSTLEDANILNYKLSSMVVGCEKKSVDLLHDKLLSSWTKNTSIDVNKENDFWKQHKYSYYKLPSKAVGSERNSPFFHNNILNTRNKRVQLEETDSWKDIGVRKPNSSTLSTLADRISELQYNVQKATIIEDHFYELLNKQL